MTSGFANALSTFADAADAITNVSIAPGVFDVLARIGTPVNPTNFTDVFTEVIHRPAAR